MKTKIDLELNSELLLDRMIIDMVELKRRWEENNKWSCLPILYLLSSQLENIQRNIQSTLQEKS